MKIRLYFDEDSMDRALVRALRVRDVIVTTALDAGLVGRPDIEHVSERFEPDLCHATVLVVKRG